MNAKKDYFYPVTAETMHAYAKSIFDPIKRGESVTTVWVPMAGRRRHNKFVIENIETFENELPNYKKYLLVYIEPLDLTEESLAGYLRLMARGFLEECRKYEECRNVMESDSNYKIFDDESASYPKLLEALKDFLKKVSALSFEIVFFLGEFDELNFANTIFYNNLKSLWNRISPKLHFVFLMQERVTRPVNIAKWGELNELILQNIVYVPVLNKSDTDYMIGRLSKEFSLEPSEEEVYVLNEFCGGHPYMLKVACRVLAGHSGKSLKKVDLENLLLEHYELQSVANGLLEVRSQNEKEILRQIAEEDYIVPTNKKEQLVFLQTMGLVVVDESGKLRPFSRLFREAILGATYGEGKWLSKEDIAGLRVDEETGTILLNGQTVEEKFTPQEYSVLVLLLQNINKLKSRNDIGDVLWGKESYERFSDWAIDQLISKLRKKLISLSLKEKLVTVRGKGYKLINSTT